MFDDDAEGTRTLPDGRAFAARRARIAAKLTADMPAAEREQLKQEIVDLFRDASAASTAYVAFKESVKSLAEVWKMGSGGAAPTPTPNVAPKIDPPVLVSSRVDHLGASTFIEKGWSLLSLGDPAGAEVALGRALQLAPDNNDADTLLGWSQAELERYEDALTTLARVLRRDARYALAYTCMGYVCLKRGHYDDAREHLAHAIQLATDRRAALYAHLYLGIVCRQCDAYEDAETYFRQTLELGPNLLQAWYEMGVARWQAGDRVGALDAWQHGATANKFNPWGKRCAAMIEARAAAIPGGDSPLE